MVDKTRFKIDTLQTLVSSVPKIVYHIDNIIFIHCAYWYKFIL